MSAQAQAAACEAIHEYDSSKGLPLEVFLERHVIQSMLARFRREWAYAYRCFQHSPDTKDDVQRESSPGHAGRRGARNLREAVAHLGDTDRWLLEQLFWECRKEVEIAKQLCISQPAIAKRKRRVLRDLRQVIGTESILKFLQ
jgi:DNA-directed RNA polymerase specialized sigma subunit